MPVRDARPTDAEVVRTIHYASILGLGPTSYGQDQVAAWAAGCGAADYAGAIRTDDLVYLVAERNGVIVGFGSLAWDADPALEADPGAEVTGVYVLPTVARQGVGTELYDALERRARARGIMALGLRASLPAVPFYEAQGYDRVAEAEHEFSSDLGTSVTGGVVEMGKQLCVRLVQIRPLDIPLDRNDGTHPTRQAVEYVDDR